MAKPQSSMVARSARPLLIAVGLLPFLPALLRLVPGGSVLAEPVEAWFAFQCHREPERSLMFASRVLPVCARCLGIYLGLLVGAASGRPRLSPRPLKLLVGFALLVMVLDVLTELLGMRPASSIVRLATGLLLAWPISAQLVWLARQHRLRAESGASPRACP